MQLNLTQSELDNLGSFTHLSILHLKKQHKTKKNESNKNIIAQQAFLSFSV